MASQTYSIYKFTQSSADAETGLMAHQVVKHIYLEEGDDYYLMPRMIEVKDDEGNVIDEIQADGTLGKEWDVYFGKKGSWSYGETEEEAEDNFLNMVWREGKWDHTKWFVFTDKEYKKREKERLEEEQYVEDGKEAAKAAYELQMSAEYSDNDKWINKLIRIVWPTK
jgi:hypothetical protein